MKIVEQSSGFGNQVFKYIFSRYVQNLSGDDVILDDRSAFASANDPEMKIYANCLEKAFGIRPPMLSDCFDKKTFAEIIRLTATDKIISLPELLCKEGIGDFQVVSEYLTYFISTRDFKLTPDYNRNCLNIDGDDYKAWENAASNQTNQIYMGNWIDLHFYDKVKDEINLTFIPFEDDYNKKLYEQIRSTNSVGLHFRSYNYGWWDGYYWDKWSLPFAYYRYALEEMRKKADKPVFYVFYSSRKYVDENLSKIGFLPTDNVVLCDGNRSHEASFRDIQMLANCKHLILSNSSFSLSAAALGDSSRNVIIPNQNIMA